MVSINSGIFPCPQSVLSRARETKQHNSIPADVIMGAGEAGDLEAGFENDRETEPGRAFYAAALCGNNLWRPAVVGHVKLFADQLTGEKHEG